MKYLAFAALIANTNAVPVVGSITKEIACKDQVDDVNGVSEGAVKDCVYELGEDIWKCSLVKPLGDGAIVAADWADASAQCAALFDTEAVERKCVAASYDGIGGGYCMAYMTSAQEVYPDSYLAANELLMLLFPDAMYGSGLGGMNLAAGSAAATLAAALYM